MTDEKTTPDPDDESNKPADDEKKRNRKKTKGRDNEFGLSAPSSRIKGKKAGEGKTSAAAPSPPPPQTDDPQKSLAWRGFEEEEEYEPEFDTGFERDAIDNELDMTPMVDVVFLLLIFFMVTASFVVQQSIKQPPSLDELPSTQVIEQQDQKDYVEVIIDQYNSYRITSRDWEEIEAPSDQEMRSQVRDAKSALNADKLIITAHEEAHHEKVVRVWDHGTTLAFDEIQIKTTTEEY